MADTPRIWCGTYAKYNAGSLEGKWFDLEDYADKGELYDAFQEFHGPGEHEFMLCDYEGFPRPFYGESHLDDRLWEWLELDDYDKGLLAVYLDSVNSAGSIEDARDAFSGRFDSEEDWAADYWESSGLLREIPENLQCYIDYLAFARDCQHEGSMTLVREGGYVWAFSH